MWPKKETKCVDRLNPTILGLLQSEKEICVLCIVSLNCQEIYQNFSRTGQPIAVYNLIKILEFFKCRKI